MGRVPIGVVDIDGAFSIGLDVIENLLYARGSLIAVRRTLDRASRTSLSVHTEGALLTPDWR
jgi:hypothetical protein